MNKVLKTDDWQHTHIFWAQLAATDSKELRLDSMLVWAEKTSRNISGVPHWDSALSLPPHPSLCLSLHPSQPGFSEPWETSVSVINGPPLDGLVTAQMLRTLSEEARTEG